MATRERIFDWDEAIRLYEQGRTQSQIATELGVARSTVGKALQKSGVSGEASRTFGGGTMPPTRLCVCGHNHSVHSRGPCGVASGCECPQFYEDVVVPKLLGDTHWLAPITLDVHRRHKKRPK